MKQTKKDTATCFNPTPSCRDQRFGNAVDECWLSRWLKIHSFYQIITSMFRVLTIKDMYNQTEEMHPETLLQQYSYWEQRKSNWNVGQICFRIIFWELLTSWILALVAAGLSMGCTLTIGNVVSFIGKSNATIEDQHQAYLQALYYIIMYIIRVYLSQHTTRMGLIAGIKVQQLLSYKIYDKLTTVSNCYKKHLNKGTIQSFFRVQTKYLYDCIRLSYLLISAPATLILAQVFLVIKLGKIGLVMLPIIIGSLIIQILVSLRMVQLSIQKEGYYEERLNINTYVYAELEEVRALGWEQVIIDKNRQLRKRQNKNHYIYYLYQNIYNSILTFAPCLTTLLYLWITISQNNASSLSPKNAYVVYTYINLIISPLRTLPNSIVFSMQAHNAMKRLNNFFQAENISNLSVESSEMEVGDVIVDNLVASIESPEAIDQLIKRSQMMPSALKSLTFLVKKAVSKQYSEAQISNPEFKYSNLLFKDISIPFDTKWKKGDRVIVLTLDLNLPNQFLKCFLGDLKILSGSLKYKGNIGFIDTKQMLFLRDTIKNNILLKAKQDRKKLDYIYDLLNLKYQFSQLQKGEETVMDDSSIIFNLTQRKKIALARCLYANSNILLLDWFFEAMEPDEAMYLYNNYATNQKIFGDKTVILTCKETFFLRPNDKVIIMQFGKVVQHGEFQQLLNNQQSKIHSFSTKYTKKITADCLISDDIRVLKHVNRIFDGDDNVREDSQACLQPRNIYAQANSELSLIQTKAFVYQSPPLKTYMQWWHYKKFFKTGGVWIYVILLILNTLGQGVKVFSDWWIGTYSSSSFANSNNVIFLVVYVVLIVVSTILLFVAGLLSPVASINNTEGLLDQATQMITYCNIESMKRINKIAFAYIISKENQDIFKLNFLLQNIYRNLLLFLGTIIMMGIISWITFLVGGVLLIGNVVFLWYYRKAQMELYRISDPLRSEYSRVMQSVMVGMSTIRSLKKIKQFRQMMMDKFYVRSPVIRMASRFTSHGLAIFGQYIALFLTITITFLAISKKFNLSKTEITLVSTALSMSTRLSGYINSATSDFAVFASSLNIAIKVLFDKIIKVYPIIKPDNVPLMIAPLSNNSITVRNLYHRSAGKKVYTLNNVNFHIPPNSLVAFYGDMNGDIQALFQIIAKIVEPYNSREMTTVVKVGNRNIQSMAQKQIPKSIMIIGSDPLIITGTLRQNLDPLNQYFDQNIIYALNEVRFWDDLARSNELSSSENFGRLDYYIQEMGKELPSGSIHKINIARAILRKPPILLYLYSLRNNPATTRDQLRQTLKRNLRSTTTILLATLDVSEMLKCDYLIGFHRGVVIEQGRPYELVQDVKNRISQMVDIITPNKFIEHNRIQVYKRFADAISLMLSAKYNGDKKVL